MYLVITEKPSVAKSISAVLNANERQDGFFIGGGYIVSWCIGHLVELAQANAYDERFSKWRYDDLPIIPEQWKYTVPKDKKKQLSILRDLMKRPDVNTIVCATDAGREGELIFRLVYDHCKCKKPIQRLWISSMEDTAIREGFQRLQDGQQYDNLYKAALCRTHADWLVGINATRLFSVLYGATLNVGRVVTPTLALIVRREAEIGRFKKEPFYIPEIGCGTFTASGDKLSNDAEAERIRVACDGQSATVLTVDTQRKTINPPKLFDLTTLQREANRLYGFTAQQTLDYLQSLYEKKLATYPRTDSRYLTEDMETTAAKVVIRLLDVMSFAKGFSYVPDLKHTIDNSKVTDHHAIIPTLEISKVRLEELPAGERSTFLLIAQRLLCAAAEKHIYEAVNVALDCAGHGFAAKGKSILHDGWKSLERSFRSTLKSKVEDQEKDAALPELSKGQIFSCVSASVREGESSPPKRYTEDTLLSAMETAGAGDMPEDAERKGLGTPATRAGTIEKLIKTGFVQRTKKQLLPTEKGINLIAVLPDMIKSPLLTAEWEHQLKQVERGELEAADFMKDISDMTCNLVQTFHAPSEEHKNLFSMPQGEAVGLCPRCGSPVHESKKGFFCDSRSCAFALWKDNKFFTAKKKSITKSVATALLKEGRIFMSGLYSEKARKTYDAHVVLADTGGKYVSFKLEFDGGGK